jgi:hypothetical protein
MSTARQRLEWAELMQYAMWPIRALVSRPGCAAGAEVVDKGSAEDLPSASRSTRSSLPPDQAEAVLLRLDATDVGHVRSESASATRPASDQRNPAPVERLRTPKILSLLVRRNTTESPGAAGRSCELALED